MTNMKPKYNHKEVEEGKNEHWIKSGFFNSGDLSKKPFCITIPPPNVTGKLHLGHAWDVTLQDITIRYKRMQGYDALFLPGMDHAGIATQAKVDEKLRNSGTNRHELGREKAKGCVSFLKEAMKAQTKGTGKGKGKVQGRHRGGDGKSGTGLGKMK